MFASYESTIIDPNYDPANPDTRLAAALKSFNTDAERQAYVKLIQDLSTRRSLNFTNVRKVKNDPKARSNLWDIENFSFTYAYSESKQTNLHDLVEKTRSEMLRDAASWQYTSNFKGFSSSFKNVKAFSKSPLPAADSSDFNFNPMPTSDFRARRTGADHSPKIVYRNSQDQMPHRELTSKYFVFQ